MDVIDKEYYIVACEDFVYYAKPVHIIAIESSDFEDELEYIIDMKIPHHFGDDFDDYMKMYMSDLEKFKTLEDAEKEAERLNNIPKNKKLANEWNKTGKKVVEILRKEK